MKVSAKTAIYRPLADWIDIGVLDEVRAAGNFHLPNPIPANDGFVLAHGPQVTDLRRGDRVVFNKELLEWTEAGRGFIRAPGVYAFRKRPGHRVLHAYRNLLLVDPDLQQRVTRRPSGVLVSSIPLYGGEAREEELGERLYHEFQERIPQWAQFFSDRRELLDYIKKQVSRLPDRQQQALAVAWEARGETKWQHNLPYTTAELPHRGRIVSVGPQVRTAWLNGRARPLRPGQTIRWEKTQVTELWDGETLLFAVPSEIVQTVEVQRAKAKSPQNAQGAQVPNADEADAPEAGDADEADEAAFVLTRC